MSSNELLGRSRRTIKKKECLCCISTSKTTLKKTNSKAHIKRKSGVRKYSLTQIWIMQTEITDYSCAQTPQECTPSFPVEDTDVTCKSCFASEELLIAHQAKHHYFRHCPNCPKSFRRTRTFIRHLQSHLNIPPYKCKICLNSFHTKTSLQEHKLHRNDNGDCISKTSFYKKGPPYACDSCDAVFSSSYDLSVHRMHHVMRCAFCRKEVVTFSNAWELTIHLRRVHRNLEREVAEPLASTGAVNLEKGSDSDSDSMDDLSSSDDESHADMDYSYQKEAAKPVYTLKRKDKFICFICYDLYPSPELLKAHMKAHNFYQCYICPKFFADYETAYEHECDIAE